MLCLPLLCAAVSWGAEQGGNSATEPQWVVGLQPLLTMPVQDSGFVRSAYTVAESRVVAIYGKRTFAGHSALLTVLRLMADDKAAQETPIIKIVRPELADVFGKKTVISLKQYRDPALQEKFVGLVTAHQADLLKSAEELDAEAVHLENLEQDFSIVPRSHDWLSPSALKSSDQATTATLDPLDAAILRNWSDLKAALVRDDPAAGARAASALEQSVTAAAHARSIPLQHLKLDAWYHQFQPFAKSAAFCLLAALAYGGALLFGRRRLHWAGDACLALGLVAQAVGIVARWLLSGRAPLSNMYESLVFAIAGMVLVALIFELKSRPLLPGLAAGVLGFIFMVLAHKAPIFYSDIRPILPALQSSWLTYHVITIMLSYSALAISFFAAVCYLVKDALGGDASPIALVRHLPSLEALDILNYKIIVVGFPLLTAGIVLGAVWANTAWGRPWGFDPKEMWSAITWLIYAVYLHVRFFAGWKGRRAAILAIVGFAGVIFTYLGVNYLLPSLHSYVG
jgi:cytochrome c-type biogenesis protein CcsB